MKLDLSKLKAVIFDMDGTMIDNTQFHKKAWIEFCKRHGITLTEEEYLHKISGKRNDEILHMLLGRRIGEEEYNFLDEQKESIYRELYKPYIKEAAGLKALLRKLSDHGLKLGIATTSSYRNRTFVLETLNLRKYFQVVIGGEDSKHGKPHPEIYLLAAQNLGVDPKNCLAFEDTALGIKSAKAAGMEVVGVLTAHSKEELQEADYFIKDFLEVNIS